MTACTFLYFLLFDPPWSFAVIGDTQSNWHIARKAVIAIKAAHPDFTVHLGDVWGCGSLNRWRATRRMFKGLRTHWVIGNHELRVCGQRAHQPKRYRTMWLRSFQRNRTTETWDHKGYSFITIDSATPDVYPSQLRWFREMLAKTSKPLFLFGHRPFPRRRPERWYRLLDPMPWRWRNAKLGGLIEENDYRIMAKFHGHWHGYRHYGKTWCSGGGGGLLARGQRYHWLLVTVVGPFVTVERKLI